MKLFKLDNSEKIGLIFLLIFFVFALGFIDYYIIGQYFSIALLYTIPVYLITWYFGIVYGILISFFTLLVWLFVHIKKNHDILFLIVPYINIGIKFITLIIFVYIISLLKQRLIGEKEIARTDFITNIANSRAFQEYLDMELNRFKRYKHPFSIAYIDIDNFKMVNDKMGHSSGDRLLRLIAQIIRSNIRNCDIVARVGGDEFAIIFPETQKENVEQIIRKILKQMNSILKKNGWNITFSIGVVTCTNKECSSDELINLADSLMYSVKNKNKNDVEYQAI